MSNKVYEIWSMQDIDRTPGQVKRLYSSDMALKVYCTYSYPNGSYGIALSFPKAIKFNLKPFEGLSILKVTLYEDSSYKENHMVCASMADADKKEVFSYLCESVISTMSEQNSITDTVRAFGNTLLRWKNLFDTERNPGLSKEEQLGLYGELYLLRKCILANHSKSEFDVVQHYVGCEKALRDFQGENWAIEVKTSAKNNPQSITINGERQLDDSKIDNLFLYHLSVEVSQFTGETLRELIVDIKKLLDKDLAAVALLNSKLFAAGYLDEHHSMYTARYQTRGEKYYLVEDSFPRIREADLLPGVGNITYSIVVADCIQYQVDESKVINKCINNDGIREIL